MSIRPLSLVALTCSLAGLDLGCSRRETRVNEGNRLQILHVANSGEVADLDPQTAIGAIEGDVLAALFEPLIQLDPVDLHPVPAAAASWDVSPDGLVWTFHLQPNAKWSNGDPVRAADWVYSFRRFITASLAAPFSDYAFVVEGAEEYFRGQTPDFDKVGVRAIDPLTLEMRLKNPTPYLPALLNFWAFYAVHPPTIEKFGAGVRAGPVWTRPGNLVGNGPFLLKELVPNDHLSVVPNPHYWGRDKVRLREIRFYPVDNSDAEERMFRSGQVHVTSTVPMTKLDTYRRERPDALHITQILGTEYYSLNVRQPPLTDRRVRRALALAIDRTAIVEKVTRGGERAALSFTPDGISGYPGGAKLRYDPEEARRLLAEAGFPGGAGFPKLDLMFSSGGNNSAIAEAVQFMWKRDLGIAVELRTLEWKVYYTTVRTGNYRIARVGWESIIVDAHDFVDQLRTGSANNWTGWSDPEYDRILTASERTVSNEERFQFIQQLDAIIEREVPIIPLFHRTHRALVNPAVKLWPDNAINIKVFQQVYLEEAEGRRSTVDRKK